MKKKNLLIGGVALVLGGVAVYLNNRKPNKPKGVHGVTPFDLNKYLGKWYEIARLDFKYEKNLNYATAEYSLNKDNSVKVLNKGYNYKTDKWEQATGKAKFVGSPNVAELKVSFFGPFYGGYNVIALDKDYQYALIAGDSLDYLWILSRTTAIPDDVKKAYLQQAQAIGYDTSKLIWTKQD